MDITLVICAHNEEAEIATAIEASKKAPGGHFREIIVVDNASTDKTAEIARKHGARVVFETKKGLPHARTAGLAATESEYIAYIDAKHQLSDTWFSVAEATFKKYPHIVALSGPRRYFGAARWKLWILNGFWLLAPIAYRMVGYMILGGNFIARKDALIQMGGFDPSIEFYGEDTDIARRLSKVGKVMFRSDFYVHSTARRFEKEGIWRTNIRYAMNFWWPVLFGKPYTTSHNDVR